MTMYKVLSAAVLAIAAFSVKAQVEVVDRHISSQKNSTPSSSSGDSANVAELYYQFQVLQQEVQQLRGMVEEQNHQIKKLKQQRLDDYLDLDRRISQLGQVSSTNTATTDNATPNQPIINSAANAADELKSYKSAINLLLKEQKHDDAINALLKHIETYPNGRYSANAQYWLGEIYLVKNDIASSAKWFEQLLRDFPEHSKVPDAQFKLGKVYHMQGDSAAAKTLLEKVATSDSSAAQLARDYLTKNF